jgi:hypothetical protein
MVLSSMSGGREACSMVISVRIRLLAIGARKSEQRHRSSLPMIPRGGCTLRSNLQCISTVDGVKCTNLREIRNRTVNLYPRSLQRLSLINTFPYSEQLSILLDQSSNSLQVFRPLSTSSFAPTTKSICSCHNCIVDIFSGADWNLTVKLAAECRISQLADSQLSS